MSKLWKLIEQPSGKTFKISVVILFTLHIVGLSLFAIYRFVDWDEGFYLQAGLSVSAGLRLYSDFFYPQAPLYPHLLSILPSTGWDYWLQARFVSVLLSALTMALVGLSVKRLVSLSPEHDSESKGRRISVLVSFALYGLGGLFLAWNSVAKPLALSQFLMVAGVLSALMSYRQKYAKRAFWILLSGVSLAFAMQTRSPMLVAWFVTLLAIVIGVSIKESFVNLSLFLFGSFIAALPSISMALADGPRFYFDNFGFHLTRTAPPSLIDILSDKLNFITRTALDPQIALILLFAISIIALGGKHLNSGFSQSFIRYYPLVVGVLLIGAFFLAFPSHRHYVVQGLPVLIIFVSANTHILSRWLTNTRLSFRRLTPALLLTVYTLGLIPYCWIYFTAFRERDQRCKQSRISEVVSAIAQNSGASDTILAELPIYAVLANRRQVARAEFVGYQYKSLALGNRFGEMNLADSAYISDLVTNQKVKLVVVENTPDSALGLALTGKYHIVFQDGYTQLWKTLAE